MDDTPIGRAAQLAVEALGRAGEGLPRPEQTRVMVVANQKGGVGKTTTTVNLAASLALHGARVLVVDLDPQGNASTALGIDHHAEVPSIYDVLVESKPLSEVVQPVPDVEGLFCAPATIDLAGAEIELVSLVARESRLQRAIQAYEQPLDYILIDCPPSLGLLTVNALVAGAEVLIPIQCEYYALEGLGQLLRNVDLVRGHLNPTLHVSTILLTMYDGRTRLASQVADEVRSHFGKEVLRTSIPRSVRISEAPELRADGAHLRPGIQWLPLLPRSGPGDRAARGRDPLRRRSMPTWAARTAQQNMSEGTPVSERRRGLGRGLGALIPAAPQERTGGLRRGRGSTSPAAVPVLTAERGVAAAKVAALSADGRRHAGTRQHRRRGAGGGCCSRREPAGAHFAELPLDAHHAEPAAAA